MAPPPQAPEAPKEPERPKTGETDIEKLAENENDVENIWCDACGDYHRSQYETGMSCP